MSEASCPNFQPRAHAGLTGLTSRGDTITRPDPRAARSLRFSPLLLFARTVDGYHPSKPWQPLLSLHNPVARLWHNPHPNPNPNPFQPPLVAARGGREGLWLEQGVYNNGNRTRSLLPREERERDTTTHHVYSVAHARLVKPARLHFARTARALTERGVVSEFSAARARGSYWFDKPQTRAVPSGRRALCCASAEMLSCRLDK